MPPTRALARGTGALVALLLAGTAAGAVPGGELGPGIGIGVRFVAILVFSLVGGGTLVVLGPETAVEGARQIRNSPVIAFVWGVIVGVVPITLAFLPLTIVGLIVTVPVLILLVPVGIVGAAVPVVTFGAVLTPGGGDPGGTAVLAGSFALAIVGAVPLLGAVIAGIVNLFGIGVIGRGLYRSWRG